MKSSVPGWLRRAAGLTGLVVAVSWQLSAAGGVRAQDSSNPFIEPGGESARQRRAQPSANDAPAVEPARPPLSPMDGWRGIPGDAPFDRDGPGNPPPSASAAPLPHDSGRYAGPRVAVEQTDLPPLDAPIDSAMSPSPRPTGSAIDPAAFSRLVSEIALPTRSPALALLLVRLVGPDGLLEGDGTEAKALRAEVLYRAGRISEADALVREVAQSQPVLAAVGARYALAVGDVERACALAQRALLAREALPKPVRIEALAIQGYCGAAQGNVAAASLAAGLAREEGAAASDTFAALEAVALGEPPHLAAMKRIGVIDWRLAEVSAKADPATLPLDRAEPALIGLLARSETLQSRVRLAAVEIAARANIVDSQLLAEIYRKQPFTGAELAGALSARVEPSARRALLFRAAEADRTPLKRTRLVRAALDDARRAGLYVPVAAALVRTVEDVQPVAEIGWFAETAVEVPLAGGRFDQARRWAEIAGQPGMSADRATGALSHWLALIDIADPAQRSPRGESLASVADVALRGRFSPDGLHRLASVLDALDYQVPMRLWETASRAPQPTTGHLPATGVLSDLQNAARRKDMAAVVALVFRALGPDGPEGAHMIALGDCIRALRRASLEREARAVAFEALFAVWPRASSG